MNMNMNMNINMNPEKPKIKIGINGFGAIGRLVARAALEREDMEVVVVNEGSFYNEHANNMSNYGLVHGQGKWESHGITVICDHKVYLFGLKPVKVFAYGNPSLIPWAKFGAEYIVECSEEFIDKEKASVHIKDGGAKKVIITGYNEDVPTFVVGVNDHEYECKPELDIVSAGSRTTNCIAPLAKIIHNRFGIIEGDIDTYYPTSVVGDMPISEGHDSQNRRTIRSNNEIGKEVGKVIHALNGKLTQHSFILQTIDISIVHLTVVLEKATTFEQIKAVIKEESQVEMKGIVGYIENDMVSRDFTGDNRSCFFDPEQSISLDDQVVKITAWYNNEWGYSSRIVDLIARMANTCSDEWLSSISFVAFASF